MDEKIVDQEPENVEDNQTDPEKTEYEEYRNANGDTL